MSSGLLDSTLLSLSSSLESNILSSSSDKMLCLFNKSLTSEIDFCLLYDQTMYIKEYHIEAVLETILGITLLRWQVIFKMMKKLDLTHS